MTSTNTSKASPSETFYSLADLYASTELLEDCLKSLAEITQRFINEATKDEGKFKTAKAAVLVFNICKKLGMPVEVRYLAVEVFDKFMSKHITQLQEVISSSSSSNKKVDWASVERRVIDQVPLRAISCVQIASKIVSNYKALSPLKVKNFLTNSDLHFSIECVIRSEMRVLKTLDFRLPFISPLTYVEMLLEVLRRNCPGLPATVIHDVTVKLLDVVYIERDVIYKLLGNATGVDIDIKLANDNFLLATSIIVAAAYIVDSESSDSFIEQMSLITTIKEADIIIFSTVLVKVALDL
ncbi:cyclin N-terminal domain-containing protein 1 isoform X2 [Hydra vulgaris]|uniref:Cyclin N-terminal domain-containing protein 1 isoform X2 n=1 Tax=Hydra vulgaris TaxID=6087 RepID=A0ABM4CNM4_HYDVU